MTTTAQPTTRQDRFRERDAAEGVHQANIRVHDSNREILDALRPLLLQPDYSEPLRKMVEDIGEKQPVNVAQVKQLSPFRYPGGKTWLIPTTRAWLRSLPESSRRLLLEPFAGGAMVGLSAASEGLVERVELVELDDDVSSVWNVVFVASDRDFEALRRMVLRFEVTEENVREVLAWKTRSLSRQAFRTIVKNRTQRGGIMAPGAGLVKTGENGKGLSSRWYPDTLVKRFDALREMRHIVGFQQGDAFDAIAAHQGATLFLDPPYTADGKKAGSRLYTHNGLDHALLFAVAESNPGPAMLTYDDSVGVRAMATRHGFVTGDVAMKNAHHAVMRELMIFKP